MAQQLYLKVDFLKVVMWVGERQNGLLENCLGFDMKMLGAV